MQLIPLLVSILLFVSSKLKPLQPGYQKLTHTLISFHQPLIQLKDKVNQKKVFLVSLPSIYYQNLALQAENEELKTQNLLLANQLNLKDLPALSWNTIPVRVIRTGSNIIATANHAEQIKPGMPLVQSTNIIGIVEKVESSIIHITPLTNPNISFPVQADPDIKGDFAFQNQTPQITNIAAQTNPAINTTVFTLPTKHIPEGLIVGRVSQILTKPSNPIQKVEVKLATNPTQLSSAQIITHPYKDAP